VAKRHQDNWNDNWNHADLRAEQAWPLVGRLARPDMRPTRAMGGIAAKAERPGRRLATCRITPAIVLSEELADIAARWRDSARCLHGQEACKAGGGTLEKDGWHRSSSVSLNLQACDGAITATSLREPRPSRFVPVGSGWPCG